MERYQYRACLKPELSEEQWQQALTEAKKKAELARDQKQILTACLYRHGAMLFLYMETLVPAVCVETLLEPLTPYLELWPEADGKTPWAPMYHIYHHSIPKTAEEWVTERASNDRRIGRIAFLKPEKLFSYTYWHYAIVQEGLLKGDKYQYISLHETILFSYFEEPRHNVNIRETEEESEVIKGWMAVNPESHFEPEKTGGENFLVIAPILMV